MTIVRAAGGTLVALLLVGCAGDPLGGAATFAPGTGMAGRWILAAPNAPSCGMNFADGPDARAGTVSPEGGCAENFFLSRRWTLDQNTLSIIDEDNQPLARLNRANGRFEGRSTAGTPVTLTPPTPAPG